MNDETVRTQKRDLRIEEYSNLIQNTEKVLGTGGVRYDSRSRMVLDHMSGTFKGIVDESGSWGRGRPWTGRSGWSGSCDPDRDPVRDPDKYGKIESETRNRET